MNNIRAVLKRFYQYYNSTKVLTAYKALSRQTVLAGFGNVNSVDATIKL